MEFCVQGTLVVGILETKNIVLVDSRGKSFLRSLAILKKVIIVSVKSADLGSKRTSKMEVFVVYPCRIGAYLGHLGFLQTSKMENFTKIVNY